MFNNLKTKLFIASFLVLLGCSFGNAFVLKAAAGTTFKNLTDGTELSYSKDLLKYIVNGKETALEGGLSLYGDSGAALAPATELFQTELYSECTFSIKDSSVTYSFGDKAVKIKVGSKNAVINGEAAELKETPVVLRDDTGVARLYIPSRAVAEALGSDYSWDKASNTVSLSSLSKLHLLRDNSDEPMMVKLKSTAKTEDVSVKDNFKIVKKSLYGDEVYTRQLLITLPGEHAEEYKNDKFFSHNNEILSMKVENVEGNTVFTFDTSVIRACVPTVKGNTLMLDFKAPWEVYKKIVVIDPGHGGLDGGAVRDEYIEKYIALDIAYKYTKDLFGASDIKVYYTRTDDTYLSLYARRMLSTEVHADMLVSIHMNTSLSTRDKGTLVCYSKEMNNFEDANGFCSEILATTLLNNFTSRLGLSQPTPSLWTDKHKQLDVTTLQGKEFVVDETKLTDKDLVYTLKGKKFYVVRACPAALVEVAFLSNAEDVEKLKSDEFRRNAGQVLFDTINELFNAYPRVRKD